MTQQNPASPDGELVMVAPLIDAINNLGPKYPHIGHQYCCGSLDMKYAAMEAVRALAAAPRPEIATLRSQLAEARAKAIEECAKVCDDYERDGLLRREYACETADELAARIRSLPATTPAQGADTLSNPKPEE